jgi:hypothetical protein
MVKLDNTAHSFFNNLYGSVFFLSVSVVPGPFLYHRLTVCVEGEGVDLNILSALEDIYIFLHTTNILCGGSGSMVRWAYMTYSYGVE